MEPTTRAIRRDELLAQMGWVRELARGLVADPSLADDLAQEAWLEASTRPPAGVEAPGALRAWLATVVRNLARKSGRSRSRRERREAAVARPEAQASTADIVARGALHSELSAAVMRLDEPYRSAVLLRYLDGLSALDVAHRQQVSHTAARKRISRGLALLRESLDTSYEGDRKAWVLALTAFVEPGTPATLGAATATVALPGAFALILKSTFVFAAVALALLAAWTLRPGASDASRGDRDPAVPSVPAEDQVARLSEVPQSGRSVPTGVAAFELEVTDERGAPRAGFLALFLEREELVSSARTDAAGRVRVSGETAPERVVLARSDFAPAILDLQSGGSSQRVVLRDGGQVSGHVEIPDGYPALELVLDCDRPHEPVEQLGGEILVALAEEGVGTSALSQSLAESGPFSFGGLPAGWTGAVELQGGWTFAAPPAAGAVEAGRSLLLLDPVQGLDLRVQPPLVVTGRVVASSGAALHEATVFANATVVGARLRPPRETRTDADGRFALGLARPTEDIDRWNLRLLVEPAGRPSVEVAQRDWSELEEASDLGDLVLDLGQDLVVFVRDTTGAPVSGAEVVSLQGAVGTASLPTDATGRTVVQGLLEQTDELLVRAARHRPTRALVPPEGGLEVVLQRTNALEVRVVDSAGRPLTGMPVRVSAERLPFATPGTGGEDEILARSLPFDQVFVPDEKGRLVLSDLEPGLPLTLSVIDALAGQAGRREVSAPAALVEHEVELVLDSEPFHLTGRVIDASGRGLPRVWIYVEGNGQVLRARSDADGAFAIGPLAAGGVEVHLEATRPGFLSVVLDGLAVDPLSEPLELVLERGRSLDVFLADADGRPVQTPFVIAAFGERAGGLSDEVEVGHHHFDLIPQAPGELQVVLGGVTYTTPIGANESSTRFELPPTGRLEVAVDELQLPDGGRTCVLLQAVDRGGEVDRTYFVRGEDGLEPRSFSLPSGRYRMQLENRRLGGPARSRVTPLGEPLEITIEAGQALSVVLP